MMRTQFSAEEFAHDAKMSRLSDNRAEVDGERTWLTKLDALYFGLLESEKPEDVARAALELAEACMDLEAQAIKHPETLCPGPSWNNPGPRGFEKVTAHIPYEPTATNEKLTNGLAAFIDAQEGTVFEEPEDEGSEEEDDDSEVPPDYDGPTCPHGRPEHEAILGKCAQCRRAESSYDNAYDEEEIGADDHGRFGD